MLSIINRARANVVLKANAELILIFREIGEQINREVLGNKMATYGQQIASQVATQLQAEFGKVRRSVIQRIEEIYQAYHV